MAQQKPDRDRVEIALGYRQRGWSVIPIRPKAKTPLVSWAKYQHEHATEEQIRDWWAKNPEANVGIVTGRISGIIVIDVDPRHGGEAKPIHDEAPTRLFARTGSGGYHLLYEYPKGTEPVSNRTSVRQGIDIRADGGYIVAPPSDHESGETYEWVVYEDPGPAPKWIGEKPKTEKEKGDELWLSDMLRGVSEGQRNDALARISGYLVGKGIPEDVTLGIARLWNAKNANPLPELELRRTVSSIQKHRRPISSLSGELVPKGLEMMGLKSYARQFGGMDVQWLIDDWLPDSTIAFVVSPPGVYKTWMTLDLAVSVASGKPFLGQCPVRNPGPVLLFQQEDFHGQIVQRIGAIMGARFGLGIAGESGDNFSVNLPPQIPLFIHPHRGLSFEDSSIVDTFAQVVAKYKARVVIIDPLYTVTETDNYMTQAARQMMVLKSLRDKFGTTFVIVHHAKKGRDDTREDTWGSQFLNAFQETGWQIRGAGDNKIEVQRHFKVAEPQKLLTLEFDISTNATPRYTVNINDFGGRQGKVIELIRQNGPMSSYAIGKELGIHATQTKRIMERMEQQNQVVKDGKQWALPDMVEEPEI